MNVKQAKELLSKFPEDLELMIENKHANEYFPLFGLTSIEKRKVHFMEGIEDKVLVEADHVILISDEY